jgi:cation:H+ antiporter
MIEIAGFIACAVVIFFAGRKLSYYGDLISELTGLGRAWIGLILLATVTSLPELISGISAAAIVQSPDLAVGGILGSCAFNLLVFALLDYFVSRNKPIFALASQNHVLAAIMGILLFSITGLGLFLPDDIVLLPWIGLTSFSFIIVYLLSMRMIYRFEMNRMVPVITEKEKELPNTISLKKAGLLFSLYAAVIIIIALFLPWFAEKIADKTGLGQSFVGVLFLAASTVLPEVAVSIGAIRQGYVDLAVGNLLGSNLFNIFILFIDDLFYTKGHILKDASEANIVPVFSIIIMAALVIMGLTYRPATKRYRLTVNAILILLVYIINLILLYRLTAS